MSFERDINLKVKDIVEAIKNVVMQNIVYAVHQKQLTIDPNKLPGLDLIIRSSVDQAFASNSKGLTDTLAYIASQQQK